ncbi:MAG: uncharacterized protein A8A55_1938 [Amphiamblys sp. WSBS2006]|nr:MAG: uncharacterized protein A8A55_1938 [Amphiamblys sp. WSBS2006]
MNGEEETIYPKVLVVHLQETGTSIGYAQDFSFSVYKKDTEENKASADKKETPSETGVCDKDTSGKTGEVKELVGKYLQKERCSAGVVLVLREGFDRDRSKRIIGDLFELEAVDGVFVQTESLAVLYTLNIPSACVVRISERSCTVSCVFDGLLLNETVRHKELDTQTVAEYQEDTETTDKLLKENNIAYCVLSSIATAEKQTKHGLGGNIFVSSDSFCAEQLAGRLKETLSAATKKAFKVGTPALKTWHGGAITAKILNKQTLFCRGCWIRKEAWGQEKEKALRESLFFEW